jgi:hypothetical protein
MAFFTRSRKGGRRREDEGMHAVGFELSTFEFVQASDELGLLRIGGRWLAPVDRVLDQVVLTIKRDSESIEIEPLPDMNAAAPLASRAGEEWRGAFTMSVEVAEDPRAELALVAGSDVRVALPRPGEAIEETDPEPEVEPEPESPIVSDLMAQLQEIARLEDEERPEQDAVEPPRADDREPEPSPEPHADSVEVETLRAEAELLRVQLQQATRELAAERERSRTLASELRGRASVESDLRNAIAAQEAELASAMSQAAQQARQAERRRDVAPPPMNGDRPERGQSRGADEDFLARLERARRASETVTG